MPSEPEVKAGLVLDALRVPMERFHSAVAATIEQIRSSIADATPSANGGVGSREAELGHFAKGRIAADRFAALLSETRTVDPSRVRVMEQALEILSDVGRRQEELCQLTVGPGQSLYVAVSAALADVGRSFGATRVYELCRAKSYNESQHSGWLRSFPQARWTEAERSIAPPLIATVNGSDLRVGALAEFLDGHQKLVLVVRGHSVSAPLVALITPRRFVVQTDDPSHLEPLVRYEGPGIAALVSNEAARFRHDPEAGSTSWDRLTIDSVPDSVPRTTIGGLSPAQQREWLAQLEELGRAPAPAASVVDPASASAFATSSAAPAEKLASWLLGHADLSDLE